MSKRFEDWLYNLAGNNITDEDIFLMKQSYQMGREDEKKEKKKNTKDKVKVSK